MLKEQSCAARMADNHAVMGSSHLHIALWPEHANVRQASVLLIEVQPVAHHKLIRALQHATSTLITGSCMHAQQHGLCIAAILMHHNEVRVRCPAAQHAAWHATFH